MRRVPEEGAVYRGAVVDVGGADDKDGVVILDQIAAPPDKAHLHQVRNVHGNRGAGQVEHGGQLPLREHGVLRQLLQNQSLMLDHSRRSHLRLRSNDIFLYYITLSCFVEYR